MARKRIFKVIFSNQGKMYELYARKVVQGEMYGFVEVEELLFGERTNLVVDPGEEQLKTEFSGVKKTHIPFTAIVRIDEVEKEGPGKVLQFTGPADQSQSPLLPPGKGPRKP